jgi:integrase
MGLGGYPKLTLAKARLARDAHRNKVKAGIDPLDEKRKVKEEAARERRDLEVKEMTFRICAEDYIDLRESSWSNRKHASQWRNTLETYAYPYIGDLAVTDIDSEHVLTVLKPIWLEKTETANRVRNRIEAVLDYAATLKYRPNENPARWKGSMANLLPSPSKIMDVKHHSALPYEELPAFMVDLSTANGSAAKALILTILCATRTSETLNATWAELDLERKIWTIPKSRMKKGKAHRIPLSKVSIRLLKQLNPGEPGDYVFPGMKARKPLSNMSMTNVLRRMNRGDITVHGFRSTFRDWLAEKTNHSWRAAEAALAHKLKDSAEAAYQRGDLLEKRIEMMETWANYCFPRKAKVVEIHTAKA